MSKSKKHYTTVRLTDTHDQWSRKVHINVRNGKVTMVYRWKSEDGRDHTQRTTLNDSQVIRIMGALSRGLNRVTAGDAERSAMATQRILNESGVFAQDE